MIHFITDTTSCLPKDFSSRYQIPVIPQIINFGNDTFYEGVDLDHAGFMSRLQKSGIMPKTAAPPPELFVEEFKRLVPTGGTILCIHPSAELSGTVRSATVAALDFPDADIRVIDTRVIGSPLCTMVQQAALWAEAGIDADSIVQRLQSMTARARLYFLVPSLEFLQRGGRIGGAQALLGSVLQIKPILCLQAGRVDRYESERTYKRALARLKELVVEQFPHASAGFLTIMHAGVPDEGKALADDLSKRVNQEDVPVYNVPPAIVTHGGPGLLAACFFTDERQ